MNHSDENSSFLEKKRKLYVDGIMNQVFQLDLSKGEQTDRSYKKSLVIITTEKSRNQFIFFWDQVFPTIFVDNQNESCYSSIYFVKSSNLNDHKVGNPF
jgi:hypothetical protein